MAKLLALPAPLAAETAEPWLTLKPLVVLTPLRALFPPPPPVVLLLLLLLKLELAANLLEPTAEEPERSGFSEPPAVLAVDPVPPPALLPAPEVGPPSALLPPPVLV